MELTPNHPAESWGAGVESPHVYEPGIGLIGLWGLFSFEFL